MGGAPARRSRRTTVVKLDLTDRRSGVVLDGVLVINKPAGWTSHDVVARARTLLGMPKVGHTGTLDPAATGVLVLCLGRATRIAEYLMHADKAYRAVLRLGVATDTQDATGTVIGRVAETLPDRAAIGEALGVGGHLASLERRRVGRFGLEQALSLDELASLAERGATETRLYTLAAALADLPALHIDCDAVEGLRHGVAVPVSQVVSSEGAWTAGAFVRLLLPDGRLVGIGKTPCSAEELKQAPPGTMIKLEKVLA